MLSPGHFLRNLWDNIHEMYQGVYYPHNNAMFRQKTLSYNNIIILYRDILGMLLISIRSSIHYAWALFSLINIKLKNPKAFILIS